MTTTEEWTAKIVTAIGSGARLDLSRISGKRVWDKGEHRWPNRATIPARAFRAALLTPGLYWDPHGLWVAGARVTGRIDLEDLGVGFGLQFRGCHFDEEFFAPRIRSRTIVLAWCHLPGANLDGAEVDGDAFLVGLKATGEVRALGAHITGQLDLEDAELTNPNGKALSLDGIRVDGGAFLTGLKATGDVRAPDARVTGSLDLNHAELTNPNGEALCLDGIRVGGGAFLAGLKAAGEVRALGAHFTSQLDLNDAEVTNPNAKALSLDRVQVDGNAFLIGLKATGEVRAPGAHITGQLDLEDAELTNPNGKALSLDGIQVDGEAFLTGLKATGEVRAPDARVTGSLDLNHAELTNPNGKALSLAGANLSALVLQPKSSVGVVDLTRTKVGDLFVSREKHATALPAPLAAVGWTVHDIHGFLRNDHRAAVDWLDTQSQSPQRYSPQPWHALADVYERNGHPEKARRLRAAAAHRTTAQSPWWSKAIRWPYGALVGYGYYPLFAAAWLVVVGLIAGGLAAWQASSFVPTDLAAATPLDAVGTSITGATPALVAATYPAFSPPAVALDVAVPAGGFGQLDAWRPSDVTWVLWPIAFLRASAWVLTALLLAGVTGLLKKT